MKILFLAWNGYGTEDMMEAYHEIGHEIIKLNLDTSNVRSNPAFEMLLTQELHTHFPDYIFTFNYFPVVSKVCNREGIPYVSWVYDSPCITLYSYTTIFSCNYIFIFDKQFAYEFIKNGIHTVHYLPLAANAKRLDQMHDLRSFLDSPDTVRTDISFVGSLYTEEEKTSFFSRFDQLSQYSKGYLDGVMAAQKNVFGYNFVEETLTDDIIKDMQTVCPSAPNPEGVEPDGYAYAHYYINRKITSIERSEIFLRIADHHPLDLYTPSQTLIHPNIILHNPVDSYHTSPYVYKCSKINLNVSLRSIKSGMPLRIFDIMGAGGFLLSNYQSDFLDYFIPGEDFAFYDSQNDLLDKINYYLHHEDERIQMAASAHDKIARAHSFVHRIKEMESYL